MVTVSRRFEWDMAHRLMCHDGKCQRLHGHRYVAIVEVSGPIIQTGPQSGMVVDYGELDSFVKPLTDETWDHRCMLQNTDPMLSALMEAGGMESVIVSMFPPTAELLAGEIAKRVQSCIAGRDLRLVSVKVYETPKSEATWTPA